MATSLQLRAAYDALIREGTVLAGGLNDLSQRATVYRQLFRDSGRQHLFPLIAAHGALWARGYFRWGLGLARTLVWQYFYSHEVRTQQLAALEAFANAFRDINRRVCVDTYANFHFTARYGDEAGAGECVSPELLTALQRVHVARREQRALTVEEQQAVFTAHFLDEQARVVGPAIEAATAKLHWPLLKAIALRPTIRFAYFPRSQCLRFHDFQQRDERVARGLQAFEIGASVGWDRVELALQNYDALPLRFFTEPEANYATLRAAVLAAG